MVRRALRSCRGKFAALAVWLAATITSADAQGSDSLSSSLFAEDASALWPLRLSVELVRVGSASRTLHSNTIEVPDGQATTFAHTEQTPSGERTFTLNAVARHHAAGAVEIEYDLRVLESRYGRIRLGQYVLHRLGLGTTPPLGASRLRVSRADIVSTKDSVHSVAFAIDGDLYEIRLTASPTRG